MAAAANAGSAILDTAAAQPGFRETVVAAKEQVFPAVLYLKCIREQYEGGKRDTQEVTGSGVIISRSGEALTNWHVVDQAIEVRCLLSDGRSYNAKVLGSDKHADLAMIKLEVPKDATVPVAKIGDSSKLSEGDFVMAMGAPWGLNRSVSIGIISCTRRFLPGKSEYSLWLQTDASISPGNSGGPLVNTHGEVIGINSLGAIDGKLGFAIPSETIQQLLEPLRREGKVGWTSLGLQLQPLRDFNRNMSFDASEGMIVADTDADSPARQAGLQARDRIIRVNGSAVTASTEEDLPAIRRQLGLLPSTAVVNVEFVRGTQTLQVALRPQDRSAAQSDAVELPQWDFTVKKVNEFETPELHFQRPNGVYVLGVKQPGNAAASQLREQDILLKCDGAEVGSIEVLQDLHKKITSEGGRARRVTLTVLRNGMIKQLVLDYSRDFARE
jgi:S1-C subfamily serine protease